MGVTIFMTQLDGSRQSQLSWPRSAKYCTVDVLGTLAVSVLPSHEKVRTLAAAMDPSASRGVRGSPTSSRKYGSESELNPRAWASSCTAVDSWCSQSLGSVLMWYGQKLARANDGRSC